MLTFNTDSCTNAIQMYSTHSAISFSDIDNVLSLFGRTNNENVIKQRLGTINDYCQVNNLTP